MAPAPAPAAALAVSEPPSTRPSGSSCVWVANLHIRKCGGTTVRSVFSNMSNWTQLGGYCSASKFGDSSKSWSQFVNSSERDVNSWMYQHYVTSHNNTGKFWSEVHCDEDVSNFNAGVRQMRAMLAPKGCRVITTLLLREPVDQLVSDWTYFRQDPDKVRTSRPSEWAPRKPENLLRWMAESQRDFWTESDRSPTAPWHEARWNPIKFHVNGTTDTYPVPQLRKSCAEALAFFEAQIAQIDHVGVIDTAEQFAQWWLLLADDAGFDAAAATSARQNTRMQVSVRDRSRPSLV